MRETISPPPARFVAPENCLPVPGTQVGATRVEGFGIHRSSGSPFRGVNPIVAHGVGVPSNQIPRELSISGMGQRPIGPIGSKPTPIKAHCPIPTEKLFARRKPWRHQTGLLREEWKWSSLQRSELVDPCAIDEESRWLLQLDDPVAGQQLSLVRESDRDLSGRRNGSPKSRISLDLKGLFGHAAVRKKKTKK